MKINSTNNLGFRNTNGTSLKPIGINNFAKMNQSQNNATFAPIPTIQEPPAKKKINKKVLIGALVAFGAIAGAVALAFKGKKDIKPLDVEYKNQFIDGLKDVFGLEKKPEDIASIMGPEEFRELLLKLKGEDLMAHENAVEFMTRMQKLRYPNNMSEYIFIPKSGSEYYNYLNNDLPKEELENYYRPIINGTCRLFLTSEVDYSFSKPDEAAKHFLDKAVEYANKVAKQIQDDKPPFTVGILEKNGIEIHQEIAKELSQNPEKYKNLKVIFGAQTIESRKYFINPFDKELIKCCKDAKVECHNALKEIFKNVYILPEGETVETQRFLIKNGNDFKKLYPQGAPENWRTLSDDEIEEFLNDQTIKRYREYESDNKSIFEAFYKRYAAPHLEEDFLQEIDKANLDALYQKIARNLDNSNAFFHYDNYMMPKANTFKNILNKQKFFYEVTEDKSRLNAAYQDQLELRDRIKKSGPAYYGRPSINCVEDAFKKATPKGEKYDYHKLLTKEQIINMLDVEKRMIYPPSICRKPSKYIFGDRIKMTDELWQKIIEK